MPAFIRTAKDEARWAKAKAAAKESKDKDEQSFDDQDWALVNHIYQKMHKSEIAQSLLERLSKRDEDEDEDLDIQHHHGDDDDEENLEDLGYQEIDPYEEGSDDADAWLQEHDPQAKAAQQPTESAEEEQPEEVEEVEEPKSSRSGYTQWAPRDDYSPEHKAEIDKHMADGYSHREAERLAGAHKGPSNFQDALTHTVKPSQPSERMLKELKELAKHWLDRSDRYSKIQANPDVNPQKYAAGQMLQAHENATKDYGKAYNEFLASDSLKNLKGHERHKAIQAWKQDWKSKNPDYHEKISSVTEAGKHYEAVPHRGKPHTKSVEEKLAHILTGGVSDPNATMSMAEAAQHVGGEKTDEGYTSSTRMDPAAQFAQNNKEYMQRQQAMQQPAATVPVAPKKDPAAAIMVIRRKANPQQLERFERIGAARAANGIGTKKPEGGGQ